MGTKHCEWRTAGAQLGIDGWCRTPYAPAHGFDAYTALADDFPDAGITSTTAWTGWTVTGITETSTGTLVSGTDLGGWMSFTGGANDGAGIQAQHYSVSWLPTALKDIWFECSIKLTDCDDIDWMVGLAATDTNIQSTDPTELIVFRGDDGDANIDFQVRDGGTGAAADTTVDTANTTAIRLGFHVVGVTSVTPYINGTAYTAVTANIPTSAMQLTFGMLGGATTASNAMGLDWYRLIQVR